MFKNIKPILKAKYNKIVNSIAFYPAAIGLLFLLLSFGSIAFDFSETGKQIKSTLHWVSLKDAGTARSIISAIVAGIISLTVFSFSMVMIVLNQAASQMSNRVLDKLIGNRFQQITLGVYIGTIVYALFLLSTIRDIDSGVYIPALSTYLLIVLTVLDIFIFIYFLHYITQSVRYEVVIQRIYNATRLSMRHECCLERKDPHAPAEPTECAISANVSGVYEGCAISPLAELCCKNDLSISFSVLPGSFVLKGTPIGHINKSVDEETVKDINTLVHIHKTESIDGNYFYGFKQLMEVAIKALSPGINDPDTAVISLRMLFLLYAERLSCFPKSLAKDEQGNIRIFFKTLEFETIFEETLLPIWDYGKNDRIIRKELEHMLRQLYSQSLNMTVGAFLRRVREEKSQFAPK